jgi:hypothetical protein
VAQAEAIPDERGTARAPRPFPNGRHRGSNRMVSLRELKSMAHRLDPSHPLRILVLGEPDEIPRQEYATKVVGWFRLINSPVDSTPLGDHLPP